MGTSSMLKSTRLTVFLVIRKREDPMTWRHLLGLTLEGMVAIVLREDLVKRIHSGLRLCPLKRGQRPWDSNHRIQISTKSIRIITRILWACVAWIVGGAIVTRMVIMFLYEKHVTELDINTKKNNDILMAARSRARMYGSVEEQKEAMNQKWVEEKLLFEQRMKKYAE